MSINNQPLLIAIIAKRIRELEKKVKTTTVQAREVVVLKAQLAEATAAESIKGGAQPGPTGPAPAHQWQGTKLRFKNPDGTWGKWADLEGPPGARVTVLGSSRGSSGGTLDLSSLPLADGGPPEFFVVQQYGQWVRATYDQVTEWIENDFVTCGGEFVMDGDDYITVPRQ